MLGLGIQRTVIAPVANTSVLAVVIVTIGLLLTFNGLASFIWSPEPQAFPSPFPNETWQIAGVSISQRDVGTLAVVLGLVVLLWAFFQFTKIGLALRASALNPDASRLVGVRVGWMLAIGWGLAAVLGAVAGMLAAPSFLLSPTLMQAVLIYAFAAAVLGGIDSPFGAVVGGLLLGVGLNLIETYVDFVGADLKLPVALLIILVVLLVRPGRHLREARREARVSRRTLINVGAFLAAVVVIFVLPSFISSFRAQWWAYVAIYLIALVGLQLLTGITGLISLGHGAFMLVGGYVTAILISDQDPPLELFGHQFTGDMRDLWTIPHGGARRRARRIPLWLPGASADGPLPRARDLCDRGRSTVGREEVRRASPAVVRGSACSSRRA